ncbi:MAG: isoprenylcysteine carboxylmethyltransferase family protein [Pseudomonadota bacterium]
MKLTLNPDKRALRIALIYGALCHGIFALAGLAMLVGLYFGMSLGQGSVPWPWAGLVNALLLLQFPLGHSFLLSDKGRPLLEKLAPAPHGKTLSTTVYATIASIQLLVLFVFWTPSDIILWRAEGLALALITLAYLTSWALLTKASFDAGPEVQSGSLGWTSLARDKKVVFPDMPETGLFKYVRQPIYISFALVLWTVPVWTPDQLVLATAYTAYCIFAPKLKERRFTKIYKDRFRAYQDRVPYWIPRLPKGTKQRAER